MKIQLTAYGRKMFPLGYSARSILLHDKGECECSRDEFEVVRKHQPKVLVEVPEFEDGGVVGTKGVAYVLHDNAISSPMLAMLGSSKEMQEGYEREVSAEFEVNPTDHRVGGEE